MEKIARKNIVTFNGPLEAGVRIVFILSEIYPNECDLKKLTALDFLLLETETIGGPQNMHPSVPFQNPVTEVRRTIVQHGINMMMAKKLITRNATENGIFYSAGEASVFFTNSLRTEYHKELQSRARWLMSYLKDYDDEEFYSIIRSFFKDWVSEFQYLDQGMRV